MFNYTLQYILKKYAQYLITSRLTIEITTLGNLVFNFSFLYRILYQMYSCSLSELKR